MADDNSFFSVAREMLSPPRFWDETPEAALSRLEANWKPIGKPGDWAKGIKDDPEMQGSAYFDFSEVRRRKEDGE